MQGKTLIDEHTKMRISGVTKMLGFGWVGYFCRDEFLLDIDKPPPSQQKEPCIELLYGDFIGMTNELTTYFWHGRISLSGRSHNSVMPGEGFTTTYVPQPPVLDLIDSIASLERAQSVRGDDEGLIV
jgi:hypothetical protein